MKNFLLIGVSSLAVGIGACATAQTGGPATPPGSALVTPSGPAPQTVAPPAASDGAAPGGPLEDIVVTATRREERLQRIPVTVTAITAETLTRAGVVDARSLSQLTPGLTYTRSASVGQPVIRGVGSTGTSPGDESNVATYIDGVYQASPYATLSELVNVQRVEVLRGPQGTVFGRNATGGLINIITPDPSFTLQGNVSATYGRLRNDANDVDLRGYVTAPITSTLAADLSLLYRRDDNYVKDLLRGGALGGNQVYAVRSKLLFTPSDRDKIILTVDYGKQEGSSLAYRALGTYTRGSTIPGFINAGPWQAAIDIYPVYNYKRFSTSLRTSFDLGFATLETTGAYNYSYSTQFNDSDGSNFPIATANPQVTARTYSQEVRLLSSGTGRFKWIVGAYGFYLDTHAPTLLFNAVPPGPFAVTPLEPFLTTRSYAGFAEGTYEVVPKLFVTGGVRYTTERRTFRSELRGLPFLPTSPAASPAVADGDKVTYRAAVRYQITPDTNIYGSYGTGFKSGVFNGYATRGVNYVQPETLKAAEIGIKSDITKRLRVNLSAYDYDYRNLQVNARDPIVPTTFLLQNAPKVTVYGGELEVTASPVREFSVSGFVTYAHGRYDDFPLAQVFVPNVPAANGGNVAVALPNAAGNQLVRTPSVTFNVRPSWEHPVGSGAVEASTTIFHSTRVFWDYADTLAFSQKPYTLVSAEVGYRLKTGWRFSAGVTNLFDEQVAQQIGISASGTIVLLERPRRVSITAAYAF